MQERTGYRTEQSRGKTGPSATSKAIVRASAGIRYTLYATLAVVHRRLPMRRYRTRALTITREHAATIIYVYLRV